MKRRVLVTRAVGQAAPLEAALRAQGLEPVLVPAIAIEVDPSNALVGAMRRLREFDWVAVTSPNGADAILAAARRAGIAPGNPPRWAAIGGATADALEREGIGVDLRPTVADAQALAEELPIQPGDEVLLPRGDLAAAALPRRLRERGAVVTEVAAYRTIEGPASARAPFRDALATGLPDAVLFASGSAVRGLAALAAAEGLDVRRIPAICIGGPTAGEAARLGFEVVATSPEPDASALAATTAMALAVPLEAR